MTIQEKTTLDMTPTVAIDQQSTVWVEEIGIVRTIVHKVTEEAVTVVITLITLVTIIDRNEGTEIVRTIIHIVTEEAVTVVITLITLVTIIDRNDLGMDVAGEIR